MQNFMKVPFKMPEIFIHTLGGGLEIWASILLAKINNNINLQEKLTSYLMIEKRSHTKTFHLVILVG